MGVGQEHLRAETLCWGEQCRLFDNLIFIVLESLLQGM